LKLLERMRLFRAGSVLVADNVVCPGAPALLEYLGVTPWTGWNLECDANFPQTRAERKESYENGKWTTRLVDCAFEYRPDQPDAITVSVFK
jgi:predicted O-methyltransferase YrrM